MTSGAEVEWQTKLLGQRQNRRRTAGLLNESFRWVLSRPAGWVGPGITDGRRRRAAVSVGRDFGGL